MGFPSNVYAPASKSAGQTIQAAFFNDPDAEITAIENAIITGPINLQASTIASLSVSGGSTVTTLNVTGGSTFATRPIFGPPDAARVSLQSLKDLGSSVNSTILWTSDDILINSSVHSTSVNPERLTPQSTGVYLFTGQILSGGAPAANTQLTLSVRDSSGTVIGRQDFTALSAAGALMSINVSGIKRFDALGGYAVVVLTNVTAASTVSLAAGAGGTWFSMVKL